MPHINQVALTGRLVQDPEFHANGNGSPRLNARLAVNRPYRDRNGEWQEETSFINIVTWDKLAEYASERLHKGAPVFVSGRLRSHSWKDEEQNPHSLVEIQVRTLQLLEKPAERGETGSSESTDDEDELVTA
jgi:single-strand DNA-binding protein